MWHEAEKARRCVNVDNRNSTRHRKVKRSNADCGIGALSYVYKNVCKKQRRLHPRLSTAILVVVQLTYIEASQVTLFTFRVIVDEQFRWLWFVFYRFDVQLWTNLNEKEKVVVVFGQYLSKSLMKRTWSQQQVSVKKYAASERCLPYERLPKSHAITICCLNEASDECFMHLDFPQIERKRKIT